MKEHSSVKKKQLLRCLIEDIDENWFSFFSGMLANIPISLLFMFQKWGETIHTHCFFILHIVTFILSLVLVFVAFLFAITKIRITNDSAKEYETWVKNNGTTSIEIQNSILSENCSRCMPKIRVLSICFLVFGVLSFLAIITLWILYSIV